MRKVALISVIIFFVTLLLTVTAWSDENNPCVRNIDGKTACPPEGGTCLNEYVRQDCLFTAVWRYCEESRWPDALWSRKVHDQWVRASILFR